MSYPIHKLEFAAALARCLPLLARPVVAVANSAGPDSTCLLFLLRQLFPPHALLSVHVHHHLQPASSHMARTAAENASILGIPHHVAHIPWGVPPFPPLPTTGPVERIARDARYNLLFHVISRARVSLLALGHHADDQLETAIMRLARGSTLLAAGMRPCRRWGMGSDSPLAFFGHQGLNALILRPLLPFPKDRILATCHTHHLHYVNDPTNVQPHITPRNAIRRCLRDDPLFSRSVILPPTAPVSLIKIKNAASLLQSVAPDVAGEKRRLYSAVARLTARAEHVDRKVTFHLTEHALPSPIGTLLLSSDRLIDITDPDVRLALVLRVIRYVSFHPWGSLRADADRRQSSIRRIIGALWPSDSQASRIKKFTAGGGVLWTPAIYNPNKSLRVGSQCLHSTLEPGDQFCWLASRTPPFSKNPQHQGAGSPTKLVIDLTEQLRATMTSDGPIDPLQVLYDCRFLLCIDPLQIPAYLKSALDRMASIKVLPFTRYYWPKVVLQRESHPDQVLAVLREDGTVDATGHSSWISIQWVRPLDAI